jgi:mannitol/fructose-specific phosphotransferase system IIA component
LAKRTDKTPADFRLGELLTRAGLMTRARLDAALARLVAHNGKLGALLVELGQIDEAELYAVLALQSGLHQVQAEDVILFLRGRLGDILVGAAAINEEQLLRALLQQETSGEPLGEILVRQGAISLAVREGALGFQRTLSSPFRERFRLGRMLLEAGIVDPVTLEAAIRRQRGARVKLGDALLEMNVITQEVLEAFLKRQRRLLAALAAGMAVAADAHGLPSRASS